MRYIISPEKRAEVISRYLAGDRPKNIAIALGINDWNVSVIMRRAGLARNQVDAQQLILSRKEWIGNTRYTLNHAAFSEITPDSAYWAGFLMADGCVTGNKVKLGLALKDRTHVEKFRSFTGSDAPIRIDNLMGRISQIRGRQIRSTGSASVTVASERIALNLAAFGITERKTFTARTSGLEMNRDFWRGMIDGDGSIICSGRKVYLALIGSEPLMTQFLAFCKSIVDTYVTVRPSGNIFKVYMSSGVARAMIDVIYRDAETFLERKMTIAKKIMITNSQLAPSGQIIPVYHPSPTFDMALAKTLYDSGSGYKRLSREFGVSAQNIRAAFVRKGWHVFERTRGKGGRATVHSDR